MEARVRLGRLGLANGLQKVDRDVVHPGRCRNYGTTGRIYLNAGRETHGKTYCVWLMAGTLAFALMAAISVPGFGPATQHGQPNCGCGQRAAAAPTARDEGRGTIPDVRSYVIEHPVGRDWQQFHNVTLSLDRCNHHFWCAGAACYFLPVAWHGDDQERTLGPQTRPLQRLRHFVHWMTATCFIILAITGLNVTCSASTLAPEAFTTWSESTR